MKNYLSRLGLSRKASDLDVADAIDNSMDTTGDIKSAADAETILSQVTTRVHYERAHLQYEAINAALECLDKPGALDTHRWPERLVEFDVEYDDTLA